MSGHHKWPPPMKMSCYELGDRLMVVGGDDPDDYDTIYCLCGARGKVDENTEPTPGGSYWYVCSRTGAALGWSGL